MNHEVKALRNSLFLVRLFDIHLSYIRKKIACQYKYAGRLKKIVQDY
jgi:hypothetical protein